jgi:hypothetical protein
MRSKPSQQQSRARWRSSRHQHKHALQLGGPSVLPKELCANRSTVHVGRHSNGDYSCAGMSGANKRKRSKGVLEQQMVAVVAVIKPHQK